MKASLCPLLVGVLVSLLPRAQGVPGDLDPSFGTNGVSELDGGGRGDDFCRATSTTADGKLLLAGSGAKGSSPRQFSMIQVLADGSLDREFGDFGRVITLWDAAGSSSFADAVKVQPDGKILLAGHVTDTATNESDFALARYEANGAPDLTFGGGTGRVRTHLGTSDEIHALAVLPDGNILAAGHSRVSGDLDITFLRYLPNGELDPSFGSGGIVRQIETNNTLVTDMVVPNGTSIYVSISRSFRMTIRKFSAAGVLDTSFGENGDAKVPDTIGAFNESSSTCLAYQAPGLSIADPAKLYVGGSLRNSSSGEQSFAVARFTLAGALDTTFDGDGIAVTDTGGSSEEINSLLIQTSLRSAPKILAAGTSYPGIPNAAERRFTLVKYLSGGALDTTFDSDGIVHTSFEDTIEMQGAQAVLQNSRIVMVGQRESTQTVTGLDFLAVRYHVDSGQLDTAFSQDGISTWDVSDFGSIEIHDLAEGAGGKLLVVGSNSGTSSEPSELITARLLEGGERDGSFAEDGTFTLFAGGSSFGRTVVTQPDGKILIGGSATVGGASQFLLVRLLPDGTLDPAFGVGGWLLTDFGTGDDEIHEMVLQPDGKILVAGITNGGPSSSLALARYDATGALDTSFDGDGKLATVVLATRETVSSLTLQTDGKILLCAGGERFLMIRFLATGAVDTTFGSFGRVSTLINDIALSYDATLQPDGKIVVTGVTATLPSTVDTALARYLPNGTLDPSFGGGDGIVTTAIGVSAEYGRRTYVGTDGGLLCLGFAEVGGINQFAMVNHQADGSLDSTFGLGGKVVAAFELGSGAAVEAAPILDWQRRVVVSAGNRIARILTTDAVPGFGITSITRLGNGIIRLEGLGTANGSHTVRISTTLQTDTFSLLGTVEPDASGHWFFEDAGAPSLPVRFYMLTSP